MNSVPAAPRSLYPVRTAEPDFFAGITADGRQVLIGCDTPDTVKAFFFDSSGTLMNVQIRTLPAEPRTSGLDPAEPAFAAKVSSVVGAWHEELGFRDGRIKVAPFKHGDTTIKDVPSYLEAAAAGSESDPELVEAFRQWMADGQFVLWWSKEYWMDKEGNVEST